MLLETKQQIRTECQGIGAQYPPVFIIYETDQESYFDHTCMGKEDLRTPSNRPDRRRPCKVVRSYISSDTHTWQHTYMLILMLNSFIKIINEIIK